MLEAKECRICLSDDNSRLFRPCRCNGTNRYIHEKCLNTMRLSDPKWAKICPTCNYTYKFKGVRFVKFITHPLFITFLTLFLITGSLYIVSRFLKFTLLLVFGMKLSRSKLIFYSGLLIGTISSILALFSENGGEFVKMMMESTRYNPTLELLGYSFATPGFIMFIWYSYQKSKILVGLMVVRIADTILEY